MDAHHPTNNHPTHARDLGSDILRSHFIKGDSRKAIQTIVAPPLLDKNDSIQLIRYSGDTPPSWQTPASSIVTLTPLTGSVLLKMIPKVGDTRTISLGRFQTAVVWPGAAYQIDSQGSEGSLLRLQRNLKSANALSDQGPPPTSGYFLPPSQSNPDMDGISTLLPPNEVPGFELKLVEGFTENEPHYHRTFGEAYIVTSGTITTRLTSLETRKSHTEELSAGDCVVIPPNTIHHVIGGSEDNKVVVAYWPRFRGTAGDDWNPA
jgi:mannose-6-phosphate isomerase-like protein (cupin superfamily)